jgi:putative ABC transport system substrate-binding protein
LNDAAAVFHHGISNRAGTMRLTPRRRLLAALAALGGMAAGGHAQQPAKAWRIGFLSTGAAPPPGAFSTAEAVLAGLRERGHARLESQARYADGRVEQLSELARQVLQWQPDLIVTQLTPAAVAAARATRSVPIVMAGAADPVEAGLVQSLARPGGNITGVASLGPELAAKVVELMHEMRPGLRRLGVLAQANNPSTPAQLASIERAGARLGLQLHIERVQDAAQFEAAFRAWRTQHIDAVFIQPSVAQRPAIDLALRHGMAAASFNRGIADGGGLFAYAPSAQETVRLAAAQADRILRGTPPAQLPVQQNTRFDLIVNLRTADALGLKVPPGMLARATEVLQ